MTRNFVLAAALLAFATPAMADTATSIQQAALTEQAQAQTARQILAHQGYVNISDLDRDSGNRWTGTALKDGKVVPVAVVLPPLQEKSQSN